MSSKKTRAEIVYLSLHQAIIEQALAPGSKLPEDIIGAHFGVSRTIVRSAFARLSAEGLVDARPKRTAMVAQPSLEEAKEIFEVRRCLERQAVRLVIERWVDRNGSILEGHVRQEQKAAEAGPSAVSIRLAGEFHLKLAEMTGNRLLQRYVGEVVSRCSLILALYGRPHSSECAVNEQREIIAALRAGDSEKAVAIMDRHVGSVEKRALIQERPEAPDIGAVLARYSESLAAMDSEQVVPLAPAGRTQRTSR
jgi:DNA-binding GntR family transcriptional regulator